MAFPKPPAIPVFVMLPLDSVNGDGAFKYASAPWFAQSLHLLANSGAYGVAVDVWWGAVEREPGVYNWTGYKQLLELIRPTGLKLQIVLSFHACGGNVGDTAHIPLPPWVLRCGENDPDLFFTDRPRGGSRGQRNREYISVWADEAAGALAGRSPMECYEAFMASFRDNFAQDLGSMVEEVVVGAGPCGELRYPSYVEANGWRFPGVGEFQCYDRRALASLAAAARERGCPEWGFGGPHDTGDYNSNPEETGFYNHEGSWDSPYGRFFLEWYSGSLMQHGDRLMAAARRVFGHKTGVKVPGSDGGPGVGPGSIRHAEQEPQQGTGNHQQDGRYHKVHQQQGQQGPGENHVPHHAKSSSNGVQGHGPGHHGNGPGPGPGPNSHGVGPRSNGGGNGAGAPPGGSGSGGMLASEAGGGDGDGSDASSMSLPDPDQDGADSVGHPSSDRSSGGMMMASGHHSQHHQHNHAGGAAGGALTQLGEASRMGVGDACAATAAAGAVGTGTHSAAGTHAGVGPSLATISQRSDCTDLMAGRPLSLTSSGSARVAVDRTSSTVYMFNLLAQQQQDDASESGMTASPDNVSAAAADEAPPGADEPGISGGATAGPSSMGGATGGGAGPQQGAGLRGVGSGGGLIRSGGGGSGGLLAQAQAAQLRQQQAALAQQQAQAQQGLLGGGATGLQGQAGQTQQHGGGAVTLTLKIAGIHWWFRSRSHAAELTAGYYNTATRDGYGAVVELCCKHRFSLTLTCVEMCDTQHPPPAQCGPEGLLKQVRSLCAHRGVPLSGENALPIFLVDGVDSTALDRIVYNTRVWHGAAAMSAYWNARGGVSVLHERSSSPEVGGSSSSGMMLASPSGADHQGYQYPYPSSHQQQHNHAHGGERGSTGGMGSGGQQQQGPGRGYYVGQQQQQQHQQQQACLYRRPSHSGSLPNNHAMFGGGGGMGGSVGGGGGGVSTSRSCQLWPARSDPAITATGLRGDSYADISEPLPPMRSFTFLRLAPQILQPSYQAPWMKFMWKMREGGFC